MSSQWLIIKHVILCKVSESLFKWIDSVFGDHTLGQRVPLSWNSWEEWVQELGRSASKWNDGHRVIWSAVIVESSKVDRYIRSGPSFTRVRYMYAWCMCPQEGLSGLMLATEKDEPAIVEALLDAKADPNITDKVWSSVSINHLYGLLMWCIL